MAWMCRSSECLSSFYDWWVCAMQVGACAALRLALSDALRGTFAKLQRVRACRRVALQFYDRGINRSVGLVAHLMR